MSIGLEADSLFRDRDFPTLVKDPLCGRIFLGPENKVQCLFLSNSSPNLGSMIH